MTTHERNSVRAAGLRVRAGAAHLVWWACVACAVLLSTGVLLVALEADPGLAPVDLVLRAGEVLDLGVLDRDDGAWRVSGGDAAMSGTLLNWGTAALAWLALGYLLDRLVGPRRA
ncbi:hypothetical protein [Nocardioides solisilvae]|uniref:hypothetical protein n=1 Tax=Nocardioides solisilvae TaxID=1542435 RepID=UPI000D74B72F|nr:hypothetical protein [Nocardioides solisilvae]